MITPELAEVLARTLPVMLFLVAITVVAEIADLAGVFDVAGHATARAARHRTVVLWLLLSASRSSSPFSSVWTPQPCCSPRSLSPSPGRSG